MSMINFNSFHGTVTMISDFITGQNGEGEGCYKLLSVDNGVGASVNFVVSPSTYFVDHVMVAIGDRVTGYYDGNAPVPLIYPPQYRGNRQIVPTFTRPHETNILEVNIYK
jgi:hypothetical protein